MKRFDVCGIGNGILDILVRVDEATFASLNLKKGSMTLVDHAFQNALLQRVHSPKQVLASGGSVANSVIACAQLGAKTALICMLGDDRYGLHYQEECEVLTIELGNSPLVGKSTGTCIALITPDGERTMCTCLGVNTELSPDDVPEQTIRDSKWLFVEGYLLANDGRGPDAVRRAVTLARAAGTKVALTFSEAFIVEVFGDRLREIAAQSDLIFTNLTEASAFTGKKDVHGAFAELKKAAPNAVMTAGPEGAYFSIQGRDYHSPGFPCDPLDLTGAGDMFAGAMLYALTHDIAADRAGRGACYLAMKVISQIGARLHSGVREYWKEAITAS